MKLNLGVSFELFSFFYNVFLIDGFFKCNHRIACFIATWLPDALMNQSFTAFWLTSGKEQ